MSKSISAIFSERLTLEPFSEKFLTDQYVSWLNNKIVNAYSEQRHNYHTLN